MVDGRAPTSALRVASELRDAILTGQLEPTQRLQTEALASRFGTSRTPIREALLILEREGLVELAPNRGAIVRSFDAGDLIDLFEVRELLEPFAAARASQRVGEHDLQRLREVCDLAELRDGESPPALDALMELNDEFHRIVVRAAGSPRVLAALQAVAGIPRPFRAVFWSSEEQRARSLFCHRQILTALELRRPESAGLAMRLHVVQAREFLVSLAGDEPGQDGAGVSAGSA